VKSGALPETVTFVFAAVTYSLDLSNGNAGKVRAHLQPWLDAEAKAEPARPTLGLGDL
jgi:hypothetical protein